MEKNQKLISSSLLRGNKDHTWNNNNNNTHDDQRQYNSSIVGFSWPPRSYGCSFCKREFRSAQALGGHMNVHRRDRAMLRQHSPPPPPLLDLNFHPNPNFSVSPSPLLPSPLHSPRSGGAYGCKFLSLEIGHFKDKEDLDLELRLGYL